MLPLSVLVTLPAPTPQSEPGSTVNLSCRLSLDVLPVFERVTIFESALAHMMINLGAGGDLAKRQLCSFSCYFLLSPTLRQCVSVCVGGRGV